LPEGSSFKLLYCCLCIDGNFDLAISKFDDGKSSLQRRPVSIPIVLFSP
uniref:Ovule protein n=1 Tax=Haemonchus placei TaxID=6290 RepID=A0A0N4VRW6_HAEPC